MNGPADQGDEVYASAMVHCFRCDTVVTVHPASNGEPLPCPVCRDTLLGPSAERPLVRWSPDDDLPAFCDGALTDPPTARPRRRAGSMLAGGMLGLHQALYGPVQDDAPITYVEDEPDRDLDLEVHLGQSPATSWVRFRRPGD